MVSADALAERLLQQFPPGRAYSVDALRDGGLPRPLVHFIEQALQRRLVLEREVLDAARDGARSPWFDAGAAPVQAAWKAYFDTLSATARVPADEWPHALRQAARQVAAYLLRPASALTSFVFAGEQGELATEVLLRRMAYFVSYPYLHEVVGGYVRERGLEGLNRRTFAALLERVERHTPERYQGDAWRPLLADLFETLGDGTPPTIEGAQLAPLFGDKGLAELARRLQADRTPLTLDALIGTLERPALAPDRAMPVEESVPAHPSAPVPTPASSGPPTGPRVRDLRSGPDLTPAMPAPESRHDTSAPLAPPDAPAVPMRPAPATPEQPGPLRAPISRRDLPLPSRNFAAEAEAQAAAEPRRPLWQRFVPGRGDEAKAREAAPLPDALAALETRALGTLSAAQRQVVLRQVFQGNTAAYADTLERLAATATWTAAARALLDVFQQQGVDLYDPAAITLTDAAEQRFLK